MADYIYAFFKKSVIIYEKGNFSQFRRFIGGDLQ
jgi:hypothetical protein